MNRAPDAEMLFAMASAGRFNRWMADAIRPFLTGDILELGAGIGNLTKLLCVGRGKYVASDTDPDHLVELQSQVGDCPALQTFLADAAKIEDFSFFQDRFDTVVCLNVLEHIGDDMAVLRNAYSVLRPGGRAIVLVPQGPEAYGSLDEVLHHVRRYALPDLESKMRAAGFHLERTLRFNRATYPGWLLNARILRRRTLSRTQLRIFDLLVPLWRRIDHLLPWPSTSLIAVGVKEP